MEERHVDTCLIKPGPRKNESEIGTFLALGPTPLVCKEQDAAVNHLQSWEAGRIWLQSRDAFPLPTAYDPQTIHQTLPRRSLSSQLPS